MQIILSLFSLKREGFPDVLGTREEEESRSDNEAQEDIDGTGEVEN